MGLDIQQLYAAKLLAILQLPVQDLINEDDKVEKDNFNIMNHVK